MKVKFKLKHNERYEEGFGNTGDVDVYFGKRKIYTYIGYGMHKDWALEDAQLDLTKRLKEALGFGN